MIRRLISRVLSGSNKARVGLLSNSSLHSQGLQVLKAGQHCIKKEQVSKTALRVVEGLQQAGFEAYIVGGAVRDLLLDLAPRI